MSCPGPTEKSYRPSSEVEGAQRLLPVEAFLLRELHLADHATRKNSSLILPGVPSEQLEAIQILVQKAAVRIAASQGTIATPNRVRESLDLLSPEELGQYNSRLDPPLLWLATTTASGVASYEKDFIAALTKGSRHEGDTPDEGDNGTLPQLSALDLLSAAINSDESTFLEDGPTESQEVSPVEPLRHEALRRIRSIEYAESLFLRATEDLTPREQVALELFFFDGVTIQELSLLFGKSSAEIEGAVNGIVEKVATRLCRGALYSEGEKVALEIEVASLKLKEPHGITLLKHWVDSNPRLSKDPRLLSLCVHSEECFEYLAGAHDTSLGDYLSPHLFSEGHPLPVAALSAPTRTIFSQFVLRRMSSLSKPSYNREVALLLGLPPEGSSRADTQLSSKRFYALVRELVKAGVVPSSIRSAAPISVSMGGLSIKNPLLVNEVVGETLARENQERVLRHRFPHLDAICKDMPFYNAVCSLVGLRKNSPVQEIRKRFLERKLLSPLLPEGYLPENAKSSYFNPSYVTEEELLANQDELIRRKWANLDDAEDDPLIASVCGIPNTLVHLVRRAEAVLGSTPPKGHPLNYLPKEIPRYASARYITDSEKRQRNISQLVTDTVLNLNNLTHEYLKKHGGSKRLALIVGAEDNLLRIAKKCIVAGYLSPTRPPHSPLHLSNGKLSYFFHPEVVGQDQALKNLAALLKEREERHGEVPVSSGLINAIRLASGGALRPVAKGETFSRAVKEVLRSFTTEL